MLRCTGDAGVAPLVHPSSEHPGARDCQTHWLEQRLDHFSWRLPPAAKVLSIRSPGCRDAADAAAQTLHICMFASSFRVPVRHRV